MKKSLYIFLSSLLGVLLFLTLHRIIAFFFLALQIVDYRDFNFGLSYMEFAALDYVTLVLALMLGAWYGVWLGNYWYGLVYEAGSHKGMLNHLAQRWRAKASGNYNLEEKIASVKQKLEKDLGNLEKLAGELPVSPQPIKRKMARKSALKAAVKNRP